jgi:hypothetical protein
MTFNKISAKAWFFLNKKRKNAIWEMAFHNRGVESFGRLSTANYVWVALKG